VIKLYTPEAIVVASDFFSHVRNFSAVFEPDTYLFRLQYEGNGAAVVKGELIAIEPGTLILLAPGDRYELIIESPKGHEKISPTSDFFTYCGGNWIDKWWMRHKRKNHMLIALDQSLLNIWKQINREKRKREENKEMTDYLLRTLCLSLDELIVQSSATNISQNRPFLTHRMKSFIEDHATENFNLREVADHVGLSVSRTVSLFKSAFGKTIMQYAMEVRLSIVVERMEYSKMSLEQIAEICGFGTYSYFFRAFRARFGVSPQTYREKLIQF
jgi:AraC family transcriptional regulator of arabinose operon